MLLSTNSETVCYKGLNLCGRSTILWEHPSSRGSMEGRWWASSDYSDHSGQQKNNSDHTEVSNADHTKVSTLLKTFLHILSLYLVFNWIMMVKTLSERKFSLEIPAENESYRPPIHNVHSKKNSSLLLQMIQLLNLKQVLKEIISFPIILMT